MCGFIFCFLNNAAHFIISARVISSCFCCQEGCFQLSLIKASLSAFSVLVFHSCLSLSLFLPSFWCHLWRQRERYEENLFWLFWKPVCTLAGGSVVKRPSHPLYVASENSANKIFILHSFWLVIFLYKCKTDIERRERDRR